ncbi:MAG: hypothetical protein K8J31_01880 [Anaerolineae bacterium]|nr:hypothetical protein [Anaerolineae bacterium]
MNTTPDNTVSLAHFDRGKVFYPLIMQYLIQLLGQKELMIHGLTQLFSDLQQIIVVKPGSEQIDDMDDFQKKLSKLLGPLEMASSILPQPLIVPVEMISRDFVENHNYLLDFTLLSAGNMLILAHELCKDKPAHDTGPLWEFLRHCRNAAAHGSKFVFRNDEPKRQAKWRSSELSRDLQGENLFKKVGGKGLLLPADPIYLLWDIEQAYPDLA